MSNLHPFGIGYCGHICGSTSNERKMKNRFFSAMLWAFVSLGTSLVASGQMYTQGRFIYTADGEKVILRGVNEMLVWSTDPSGSWVMAEMAKTGANAVRFSCQNNYSAENLEKAIQNANKNGMVAMPSIWHATGKWNELQRCVDYWLRDDVKKVLQKNEQFLMLNIANEAGNNDITDAQFVDGYQRAIDQLRKAGYKCPLVIDGTDWGKNYEILIRNWETLNGHDPLKNIVVSAHTYWNGTQELRISHYDTIIKQTIEKEIPFVFGEGPTPSGWDCTDSPYEYAMEQCHLSEIGWLGWSWGLVVNGDCKGKYDWTKNGKFGEWATPAGENMAVKDVFSIRNTSKRPRSLGGAETIAVTGVAIKHLPDSISTGEHIQLHGYALPLVTSNSNIRWSSSNNQVVQIDSKGKLKALATGYATITLTTEEGAFSESKRIVVVEKGQ